MKQLSQIVEHEVRLVLSVAEVCVACRWREAPLLMAHSRKMQAMQRQELADFALLERKTVADAENAMASQCADLQARMAEQAAALSEARAEAAAAQSMLEACRAEVGAEMTFVGHAAMAFADTPLLHSLTHMNLPRCCG